MIQRQLKLCLTKIQERTLNQWLWHLTGVWNWVVRKIELDARDKIYHSNFYFNNLLHGSSKRLKLPAQTLQATASNAHLTWLRCFKRVTGKPKFKSKHRKLNSIPFPLTVNIKNVYRIKLPIIGSLKFHKQDLPEDKIKCARIIKRSSGWYLCLFIDTISKPIKCLANNVVGIDPGFKDLLTLSNGTKIDHPKEFQHGANRLAQAQRGKNKYLTARLHERLANKRKDRNHKLSHWLIQNYQTIYFSKDNLKGMSKKFGKSVASSSFYQLRQMLKYKSLASNTNYIEVDSKFSTRICSTCGAKTGPQGLTGLSVRDWVCIECGTQHDRDVNAAINTLNFGAGLAHESTKTCASETLEV